MQRKRLLLPSFSESAPLPKVVKRLPWHKRIERKLGRFLVRHSPWIVPSASALSIINALNLRAAAACAGWLCGLHNKLNSTPGWSAGSVLWDMLFVGFQVLIVLVFAILIMLAAAKARREESYGEFVIGIFLFLIGLFATNFIASYTVGDGTVGNAAA